jgi:8-oxo-dGTP pyrophosphatase MutT (NUDIX family)
MVKHRDDREEWWCLPGGGIEENEEAAEAALRELEEECRVKGKIVAEVSHITYPPGSESYTFLVDIADVEPQLGTDPEDAGKLHHLVDVAWLRLKDIPERDRVFLWWAGLLSIPRFFSEIEQWGNDTSYPGDYR